MKFDTDTMKVRLCKKCKGLGLMVSASGETFKCSECGGTGRSITRNVKDEFSLDDLGENVSFDEETMKVKVCKTCQGLGKFVYGPDDYRDCNDCGGTGRIVHQEILTDFQLSSLDEFKDAQDL